ncbi:DUF4142 domain-containing protein [Deinococcus lacus]|uniref:DUF4142 domain-containing protein n=1 Tax=Deinococcus lacus TaxID=392561 RepID=A0ABW1YIH0_9DEIO
MNKAQKWMIAAALPALLASCNTASEPATSIPDQPQPAPAVACGLAAAAVTAADTCFAQQVAMSDMFEIRSSELALQRSSNDAVKAFAQQIIKDHTEASAKLKAKASSLNISLPAGLDAAKVADMQALQVKQGMPFDRAYAAVQVNAHVDAINLFESYLAKGSNAELKAHAQETLPHLRHHLEMAHQLVLKVN